MDLANAITALVLVAVCAGLWATRPWK